MSIYVLAAIVRKRLHLDASLYETLQILSLTMFEQQLRWINCLGYNRRMQFRRIHRVSRIYSKISLTAVILSPNSRWAA